MIEREERSNLAPASGLKCSSSESGDNENRNENACKSRDNDNKSGRNHRDRSGVSNGSACNSPDNRTIPANAGSGTEEETDVGER